MISGRNCIPLHQHLQTKPVGLMLCPAQVGIRCHLSPGQSARNVGGVFNGTSLSRQVRNYVGQRWCPNEANASGKIWQHAIICTRAGPREFSVGHMVTLSQTKRKMNLIRNCLR